MDLSSLNLISDQSESVNNETQQFIDGLIKLATHWRGEDGLRIIDAQVRESVERGIPVQESLITAYQYLRSELI